MEIIAGLASADALVVTCLIPVMVGLSRRLGTEIATNTNSFRESQTSLAYRLQHIVHKWNYLVKEVHVHALGFFPLSKAPFG